MKYGINRLLGYFGYQLHRKEIVDFPVEATDTDKEILSFISPYTMTSPLRIWALLSAVKYVTSKQLEGDFVECGVWRGGSAMAIARQLLALGINDRRIWLYDTFSGMTPPTSEDVETGSGLSASVLLKNSPEKHGNNIWCIASKEDVINNLGKTGYPVELIQTIQGDILETLHFSTPDRISLLRLDTDWYASTKKELEVLYPRLVKGGVCIIDDYGHWAGAKQAVDEYLAEHNIHVLMHHIDTTGRLFIKL
jgi:O-methyltransferase